MANIIHKTPVCMGCDKSSRFELDKDDVDRWRAGEYIQNVWPDMTAEDRETMISGFHAECFDALFADEDDEDES